MKATKYDADRHTQLLSLENDLEVRVKQKKDKLPTSRGIDYTSIEQDIDEINDTLKHLRTLIISYESTFEL
jgi:hypothetical protein